MRKKLGCDYQGYEFGASYLDSVCSDGYLWDADSSEADGLLYHGGDIPCPQCNHAEWLEYGREDIEDKGWCAAEEGEPHTANPYIKAKLIYPRDRAKLKKFWQTGWSAHHEEAALVLPNEE